MLVISLLILSISINIIVSISIIVFSIHNHDEIHQIIAFLSRLVALVCFFILTPLIVKSLLGLLFFTIGHKIFLNQKTFE